MASDKIATKLKLKKDQLLNGIHEMLVKKTHLNRILKAQKNGKGLTLTFSPSHFDKIQKTGGALPKFITGLVGSIYKPIMNQAGEDIKEMMKVFSGRGIEITPKELDELLDTLHKITGGAAMPKSAQMYANTVVPGLGSLVGFLTNVISKKVHGNGLFVPGTTGGCNFERGDICVYDGNGLFLPGTIGVYNPHGNGLKDIGEFLDNVIEDKGKEIKKKVKKTAKKVKDVKEILHDLPEWMIHEMEKKKA